MERHDMSGSWVKLDLDALVEGAGAAVRNARAQLDAYMREVDNRRDHAGDEYHKNHHAQFYAQHVAKAAAEYAAAWENFFALSEARSRNEGPGKGDFEIIIMRKEKPHA